MPKIATREEWLEARRELLAREKADTRTRDELRAARAELPWVRVEKDYAFEGSAGPAGLLDMFEGRRQLIVQHFMFDPSWDDGCPSCTHLLQNAGHFPHLHEKDTTFAVVSRAPLPKLEAYKRKMGWTVPWYSSYGSDFNYDFHVTMDESVAPVEFNYRSKAEWEATGRTVYLEGEQPGISVFIREGDEIFHTYSTFARGVEMFSPAVQYLDITPLGRQE